MTTIEPVAEKLARPADFTAAGFAAAAAALDG